MSLYDGLDIDTKAGSNKNNAADLSGWGSSLKVLETQKQIQAKKSLLQNIKKKPATTLLAPVIDLKGRKGDDPGIVRFNQVTGRVERVSLSGAIPSLTSPFIGSDAPMTSFLGVTDEYDPLKPNDYETFSKLRRSERQKERERERDEGRGRHSDDRDSRRGRGVDDDDDENDDTQSSHSGGRGGRSAMSRKNIDISARGGSRRDGGGGRRDDDDGGGGEFERRRRRRAEEDEEEERPKRSGGAAIAPPPSLMDLDIKPTENFQCTLDDEGRSEAPGTSKLTGAGLAGSVASKIMARMGYKEGQGLGKSEQGMSIALQVEKTSRRGGKIIHEKDLPKGQEAVAAAAAAAAAAQQKLDQSNANLLRNPSKVIILRNMVGPGEVDEDLEAETAEECSKFGKVVKCVIFEIPDTVAEEAVRIFLEFERQESAIKALVDLNGRYFGGRIVKANFYNLDRFRRLDLAGDIE